MESVIIPEKKYFLDQKIIIKLNFIQDKDV